MSVPTRCLRKAHTALPLRTVRLSRSRFPQLQQSRNASVRQRNPSDPQPAAPTAKAPPRPQRNQVWMPKTRLVVGVLFVGTLIYSMRTNPLPEVEKTDTRLKTEGPSIADQDNRRKRESGVTGSSPMRLRMESFIKEQQQEIVRELEKIEGGGRKFRIDTWTRPAGGDGISCVLQDGEVFEKAGVNTSIVYGTLPRAAIQKMRVNHRALDDPSIESLEFFAAGLSLVLHPVNPMAPTVHLNYRYFETMDTATGQERAWWFGGGTDLTPSYLFDEDAIHFHKTIKEACDSHNRSYYPRFKQWCDKYFYIPHRQESRGVGGIFFDDLDAEENDQESLFSFVQTCLHAFLPSYLPLLQRRRDMPYSAREKAWQQLRRGRYVEFNLVHDRGTSFGLNTPGARVESILMSLPLTARWEYMHEPEMGTREERLLNVLKTPAQWV